MNIWQLFQIELFKTKRTHILPLLLLAPFLVVISGIANISRYFTPDYTEPWKAMFIQSALVYAYYFLPFSLIVVCAMVIVKEHRQGGSRKMGTLPISRFKLGLAQFGVLVWFLVLELLLFFLIFSIAGWITMYRLHLNQGLPIGYLSLWCLKLFVSMLPCLACIWTLFVWFEKPVLAIGFNVLLVIPSVLVANTPLWAWYVQDYAGYLVSLALHDFSAPINISYWPIFLDFGISFIIWLSLGLWRFVKAEW
ncbi:MAG: ABC transporter permease subunit [Allobaculum sp.]|nr:ABC transporter permease subunit [Allobaculum sp.]